MFVFINSSLEAFDIIVKSVTLVKRDWNDALTSSTVPPNFRASLPTVTKLEANSLDVPVAFWNAFEASTTAIAIFTIFMVIATAAPIATNAAPKPATAAIPFGPARTSEKILSVNLSISLDLRFFVNELPIFLRPDVKFPFSKSVKASERPCAMSLA